MNKVYRCAEHGTFFIEDKKGGDFWQYPLEKQLEKFGSPRHPYREWNECPYCKKIMVLLEG